VIEFDAEVARTLSAIPVRASRQLTPIESRFRVAEVLNLLTSRQWPTKPGAFVTGTRALRWKISLWKRPFGSSLGGDSASRKLASSPASSSPCASATTGDTKRLPARAAGSRCALGNSNKRSHVHNPMENTRSISPRIRPKIEP
jgi:hypothetical protein